MYTCYEVMRLSTTGCMRLLPTGYEVRSHAHRLPLRRSALLGPPRTFGQRPRCVPLHMGFRGLGGLENCLGAFPGAQARFE